MRVSTYFAATLPEAMAQVRDALGPKAVVLSWRNVRGGVEISASVGGAPEQAVRDVVPPPAVRPPAMREEPLANHFSPNDFPEQEVWVPKAQPRPVPDHRPSKGVQERGLGALLKRQPSALASAPAPVPLAPRQPAPMPKPAPTLTPKTTPEPVHATIPRVGAFLMRAGLSAKQAIAFGGTSTSELRRALTDCLTRALRYEPIEAIPPKPILLVGPPGGGKSSCAAKLAARTLAAGHEVLLISADAERCGGADQLQAMAKRLGARFQKVMTLVDLNDLVSEARGRGMVVYVDAPSACPAQPADMRALSRMIDETRLEPVACLPADMRPDDLEDLALAYAAMGVKRAIATRFDLTARRASLLYVLKVSELALAQVSATPYISGGVAIATPVRVANLMLEPFEDALAEDAA
jgi:flagellar biosynthesis protein FlhF